MWSSRYSVLSADYDPSKTRRPNSISAISKPLSVTSRRRNAPPTFEPGQICFVTDSVFTPLAEALMVAAGEIDFQEGRSLTYQNGTLAAVSSGEERPCIIMPPPAGHSDRQHKSGQSGHYICLMATFSSSYGDYKRFGTFLRRFVVPVEPNEQILPNLDMDALTTTPPWRHPWQWAIAIRIYTEKPLKLYRGRRDGEDRRLSTPESNRLVQHCFNQQALWKSDAKENPNLRQEMYEQVRDWKPDENANAKREAAKLGSTYSFKSTMSFGSMKSFKCRQGLYRGSAPALPSILEHKTVVYPSLTPKDFPPLAPRIEAF